MSPTIDELVTLSQTLNAESDELNKTIATINEKLSKLNLGIEVWFETDVPLKDEYGGEIRGVGKVEVGFAKTGTSKTQGKASWQLACRVQGVKSSLLVHSRELRIDGLRRVQDIVQRLQTEAESQIRTMQEAKELAGRL